MAVARAGASSAGTSSPVSPETTASSHPADIGRDDGGSRRHRLEQRERQSFEAGRQHEDVERAEEWPDLLLPAENLEAVRHGAVTCALQKGLLAPVRRPRSPQ